MKEIRWELILMPLVSIVLGIYLIMQPGAATVALCSLIGCLILLAGAAGAVNSVIFQRATFMTSPLLPVSVVALWWGCSSLHGLTRWWRSWGLLSAYF